MKKIVCIAVIAMSGIVLVSCDTEAVEGNATPQFKINQSEAATYSRDEDTLLLVTTNDPDLDPGDGPGDDLPPIKPPKP